MGQSLASVSTSVQEPAPIERGGHEDSSSLKMHSPSSLPVEQSRPSSSPVLGHCPSRSPKDRLCMSSSPVDGRSPLPVPVPAHRPSVLPVEAWCPSAHRLGKAVLRLSACDPSLGSLTLQRWDVPLAHFLKSTAVASRDEAGLTGVFPHLTRIIEAFRKSAGPGSLSRAGAFAALVASRLTAGSCAPSHSTPQCVPNASSFAAGSEIALRKQARVASQKQAGNIQVPGFQEQAENVEVPGFQDQAGNVQVPNYQVPFLNDNFQTNLQPSSGCQVVQNGT